MRIIPLNKQILIEPVVTKGILSEVNCRYGTVVEIGDQVTKIKVGDVIGYESYGLKELTVNKQDLVFICEDDDYILCKIEL